jgi:hypothetical protein
VGGPGFLITEKQLVRILEWLFGKKEKPTPAAQEERPRSITANEPPPSTVSANRKAVPADTVKVQEGPSTGSANTGPFVPADGVKHPEKAPSEAENLKRWRVAGKARAWVEAHQGCWDHHDWLTLLEELRRSPFWPMQPDAIGLALEDERRQWLQRH